MNSAAATATAATNTAAGTSAHPFSTEDERWAAVLGRDRHADGVFYFAVRTTGVYCRPTCAARTPRRQNVRFYTAPDEAERAGFRPCKRCRPNEPARADRHAAAVAKACRLIESAEETPSLSELAAAAGLSRYHFHRVFKAKTGVTPKAYAAAHRSRRVREELVSAGSVTEAIYDAGYNSSGRFYETSQAVLGMRPKDFRSGGRGESIRFAVGQCSLGAILVASTGKGVCSILLGDDPGTLVRDLQDLFPNAQLTGGEPAFEQIVAKAVGLIEAPTLGLDLPLDIRGTAFQRRVWHALRKIPAGATASYAQIAKRVGAPKAVRAVAQACASNHIAVAIPCHRVVRTDGALSGYRWGVERKRALLGREASAPARVAAK